MFKIFRVSQALSHSIDGLGIFFFPSNGSGPVVSRQSPVANRGKFVNSLVVFANRPAGLRSEPCPGSHSTSNRNVYHGILASSEMPAFAAYLTYISTAGDNWNSHRHMRSWTNDHHHFSCPCRDGAPKARESRRAAEQVR